jgi:hypothetical protein
MVHCSKNIFLGLDICKMVHHDFLAQVVLLFAPGSIQLLWAVFPTVCAEAFFSQALKLYLKCALSLCQIFKLPFHCFQLRFVQTSHLF